MDADEFDCRSCAACCRDASDGRVPVAAEDLIRWKRERRKEILDGLVQGHFGDLAFPADESGVCRHLGTPGHPNDCAIYETRGAACRALEPGSQQCRAYRRAFFGTALALLVALGCTSRGEARRHTAAPPPSEPLPAAPASREPSAAAEPAPAPKPAWPEIAPSQIETDWCIEVVRVLDEESCFVLPDEPSDELLVYLHGIVPPTKDSPQKTNFETVVANTSRRAGVVALIPRGNKGLAPKAFPDWWGWPTTGPSYQRHGAELALRIDAKQKKLEELTQTRFKRRYLAGSSAGAYFAAALALHGGYPADGYGAMSGGAGAPTRELAGLPPRPFYIGFGLHDTVGDAARALGTLLRKSGWPVRVAAHPLGHGAKEVYLDEAFGFWREQR
jgi:predicted esterase/Fe-S-cluster containining protein